MADHSIDRNLLFGLLALQNDFIDREALLDAFSRWIHDRSVLLGQILRDNGALKSDEYELLRALVAKHLEKFGDDPHSEAILYTDTGTSSAAQYRRNGVWRGAISINKPLFGLAT